MNRVRTKFCGITRSEDAQFAAAIGVDALGFVFSRQSRRFVEPRAAARIIRELPPLVTVVALFMDDEPAWIRQVISVTRPNTLQFHGDETLADCASLGLPYLKAVPMATVTDVASYAAGFPGAAGFLLDAHGSGEAGGQGVPFDWSRRPQLARPLILAGGLHAQNVGEAILRMQPYAVDVSSGIESAPGIKDSTRMQDFIDAVRVSQHE
ncbi:MAG: phosphoribosylanthranilate isomerase [Xanthomonadales bacterium]|uniref:phosphoribosylanthranilate isomerase n=1 Tax=Dokdonella sp. TaxID=2291710 RepID=UPI002C2A4B68|nr:phosphoribosylanthranilate isomerase [Xanthomonadales bacterium]HQX64782.1 phosphoribosylanthranilate isomerase [Dokdonella sp.]MBK7013225.1 phosphoribosylanthranilate isomerase [Xanthomonadales bacterium]MBK7211620.1 phosphoribosylanthranilate isomerase [Xanthomonadales bacterium]MBL0221217.1 phosphoribosylanthranilate isomerase [Xanthomonadales bacterium]